MRQGGNQWSGWSAFISFFRHVAKLPIDYAKWQHWEAASIHAGPRHMHREFCIVSDFPRVLKLDEQSRPHCGDGPFCEWADGFRLYAWHGTRVPASWIEHPEKLDAKTALNWENVEERRAAAEIIGWDRVLRELNPTEIDRNRDPEIGTLLRADLPDAPGQQFLQVRCGTGRTFVLPVPPDVRTALEANAWTYGLRPDEYQPEVRT
jgi:hypothetical protein